MTPARGWTAPSLPARSRCSPTARLSSLAKSPTASDNYTTQHEGNDYFIATVVDGGTTTDRLMSGVIERQVPRRDHSASSRRVQKPRRWAALLWLRLGQSGFVPSTEGAGITPRRVPPVVTLPWAG